MNDEMRREWNRKCKDWTARIDHHIDAGMPDTITAHAIVSLFHLAMGYLGEDIAREWASRMAADAKARIGRCGNPQCGNPIPNSRSFHPICDNCNSRETVEFFKQEVEDDDKYEE